MHGVSCGGRPAQPLAQLVVHLSQHLDVCLPPSPANKDLNYSLQHRCIGLIITSSSVVRSAPCQSARTSWAHNPAFPCFGGLGGCQGLVRRLWLLSVTCFGGFCCASVCNLCVLRRFFGSGPGNFWGCSFLGGGRGKHTQKTQPWVERFLAVLSHGKMKERTL